MTQGEKYEYWLKLVEYDMETVKILLDSNRGMYVATICQQALERTIKGMTVYHTGKEAPKSKNIPFLIDKLCNHKKILDTEIGNRLYDEKFDYMEFFVEIMFYHVSDYPFSYKNVMDRFIEKDIATKLYEKTIEAIEWLKSFQSETAKQTI